LLTHLRLGLPSGLLPSGFPTNTLLSFVFSQIRATCPVHLIFLDSIVLIILEKSISYEAHYAVFCNLVSLPHSSVQIFSNIPNILNVIEQV
jgi:hypothetical protein